MGVGDIAVAHHLTQGSGLLSLGCGSLEGHCLYTQMDSFIAIVMVLLHRGQSSLQLSLFILHPLANMMHMNSFIFLYSILTVSWISTSSYSISWLACQACMFSYCRPHKCCDSAGCLCSFTVFSYTSFSFTCTHITTNAFNFVNTSGDVRIQPRFERS